MGVCSPIGARPVALRSAVPVHVDVDKHPGIAVIDEAEAAVAVLFILTAPIEEDLPSDLKAAGEGAGGVGQPHQYENGHSAPELHHPSGIQGSGERALAEPSRPKVAWLVLSDIVTCVPDRRAAHRAM